MGFVFATYNNRMWKNAPEWGIIVAVLFGVIYITRSIYQASGILAHQLDELHGKVDGIQEKIEAIEEKIDEIEANQNGKRYVNPIDL
ncbi:MAG: hypothetical protein WCC14_06640 [Acidobacteriaceae bacterium]